MGPRYILLGCMDPLGKGGGTVRLLVEEPSMPSFKAAVRDLRIPKP